MNGNLAQGAIDAEKIVAFATDYDGTLAQDGHVDDLTVVALHRLRESGRRVILITGRELPELISVCPHLDLFDIVVAENGALLYWPAEGREEVLASPIPPSFIAEMNRLQIAPYSVGKGIFATWRPHEDVVQDAIQRLGIDFHIIFNKRAVMVLPKNVSKASGLIAAIARLDILPSQVAGIGDAENDITFLRLCGISAAVSNALPSIKAECHLIMGSDHGCGVTELITGLLLDDMQRLSAHSTESNRVSTNP